MYHNALMYTLKFIQKVWLLVIRKISRLYEGVKASRHTDTMARVDHTSTRPAAQPERLHMYT